MLPVLLICYNRPQLAQAQIQLLKKYERKNVYVFVDGHKNNKDKLLVDLTRKNIIQESDGLSLKKNFQEKNLGCGKAVKKALDWFFENNKMGIVLEDDVYPSAEFFSFIEKGLLQFQEDNSIASVNGFCPWPDFVNLGQPFLKSKYFSMWGWGTWARVWENYVLDANQELIIKWKEAIREVCSSVNEIQFWQNILEKICKKEIDTWDYQFFFQSWANKQMHIRSPKTLVQNMGFGKEATHTGVEPWFKKAQQTPLTPNEPHWFLDAAYFYFRHLTYLDNGNFSIEIASKQYLELMEENKQLKLELKQTIKLPKIFKKYLT